MAVWKLFGAVFINLETVPKSKKEFKQRYVGKIPDVEKAWKQIPIKHRRKATQ